MDPATLIAVAGEHLADAAWIEAFYAADVAAYVDVLSLPAGDARDATIEALGRRLARLDPDARVMVSGEPLPDAALDARRVLARTQIGRLGSTAACTIYRGSSAAVTAVLPVVAALRDVLSGRIVTLDEGGAGLSVSQRRSDGTVRTRLLYNLSSFATYLAYWSDSAVETGADISLRLPRAGAPVIREPATGTVQKPVALQRDDASGITHVQVTATGEPRLLDFDYEADNPFAIADRTDAPRALTVQEIIARHQQAQAAQEDLLESYSAHARMQQHFRPTPADPGYDVVTESRFFSARDSVEWEELSFSVNGRAGTRPARLPAAPGREGAGAAAGRAPHG